ncbi:MAG: hypothetical protein IK099_10840 [Clostridia bacterium]|nr:hypothetical protein [Clostridia bacterium]
MSGQEKKEQEIMNQEMSQDEMETVAGGKRRGNCIIGAYINCDGDIVQKYARPLYRPDGTVNCAATVEDGSHCERNDACYSYNDAVYIGMQDCFKAWK